MIEDVLRRRLVHTALAAHVVLTIFENTPVAHASWATRHRWLSGLPHWKFFTSAPTGEGTHLLFRRRTREDPDEWTEWGELTSVVHHVSWTSLIWDPATRVPKALFDSVAEIRRMEQLGTLPEAAPGHPAYDTICAAVREETRASGVESAQFMIAASRIRGGERQMRQVLLSEPVRVSGD